MALASWNVTRLGGVPRLAGECRRPAQRLTLRAAALRNHGWMGREAQLYWVPLGHAVPLEPVGKRGGGGGVEGQLAPAQLSTVYLGI